MSARIVLTTFGSLGDVNPYVGLARALQARGHRAIIATSPWYRSHVERAGVAFRPVRPNLDPSDPANLARIMDAKLGGEYLLRDLLFPAIRDAVTDLRHAALDADVLVTHPLAFAGPIVAEERRLPWVSTVLAPMSFFSAFDVPVFPGATWLHHLGRRSPRAGRLVISTIRALAGRWSEPISSLREELGLAKHANPIFEGQHSHRLVLGLFSTLMASPQPDWPPNARVTGPILYDAAEVDDVLPPGLEAFLDAGTPPVVFTLGSSASGVGQRVFAESVDAARKLRLRSLVVGADCEALSAAGDDVFVCESAPYSRVFPRAAAIVHQGGVGTTAQALRAGRPMIVVPFAHDQPDNAARVERLGVSRTIYPHRYRGATVADALQHLLRDQAAGEAARRAGEIVRSEQGEEVACLAIEECIRKCEAEWPKVTGARSAMPRCCRC